MQQSRPQAPAIRPNAAASKLGNAVSAIVRMQPQQNAAATPSGRITVAPTVEQAFSSSNTSKDNTVLQVRTQQQQAQPTQPQPVPFRAQPSGATVGPVTVQIAPPPPTMFAAPAAAPLVVESSPRRQPGVRPAPAQEVATFPLSPVAQQQQWTAPVLQSVPPARLQEPSKGAPPRHDDPQQLHVRAVQERMDKASPPKKRTEQALPTQQQQVVVQHQLRPAPQAPAPAPAPQPTVRSAVSVPAGFVAVPAVGAPLNVVPVPTTTAASTSPKSNASKLAVTFSRDSSPTRTTAPPPPAQLARTAVAGAQQVVQQHFSSFVPAPTPAAKQVTDPTVLRSRSLQDGNGGAASPTNPRRAPQSQLPSSPSQPMCVRRSETPTTRKFSVAENTRHIPARGQVPADYAAPAPLLAHSYATSVVPQLVGNNSARKSNGQAMLLSITDAPALVNLVVNVYPSQARFRRSSFHPVTEIRMSNVDVATSTVGRVLDLIHRALNFVPEKAGYLVLKNSDNLPGVVLQRPHEEGPYGLLLKQNDVLSNIFSVATIQSWKTTNSSPMVLSWYEEPPNVFEAPTAGLPVASDRHQVDMTRSTAAPRVAHFHVRGDPLPVRYSPQSIVHDSTLSSNAGNQSTSALTPFGNAASPYRPLQQHTSPPRRVVAEDAAVTVTTRSPVAQQKGTGFLADSFFAPHMQPHYFVSSPNLAAQTVVDGVATTSITGTNKLGAVIRKEVPFAAHQGYSSDDQELHQQQQVPFPAQTLTLSPVISYGRSAAPPTAPAAASGPPPGGFVVTGPPAASIASTSFVDASEFSQKVAAPRPFQNTTRHDADVVFSGYAAVPVGEPQRPYAFKTSSPPDRRQQQQAAFYDSQYQSPLVISFDEHHKSRRDEAAGARQSSREPSPVSAHRGQQQFNDSTVNSIDLDGVNFVPTSPRSQRLVNEIAAIRAALKPA